MICTDDRDQKVNGRTNFELLGTGLTVSNPCQAGRRRRRQIDDRVLQEPNENTSEQKFQWLLQCVQILN
jgi:hypothetical protein